MFRPEQSQAIGDEADREEMAVGWGCDIDRAGQSPNIRVTTTNDKGLRSTILIPESEGLSNEQIFEQCLHGFIDEVKARRMGKGKTK